MQHFVTYWIATCYITNYYLKYVAIRCICNFLCVAISTVVINKRCYFLESFNCVHALLHKCPLRIFANCHKLYQHYTAHLSKIAIYAESLDLLLFKNGQISPESWESSIICSTEYKTLCEASTSWQFYCYLFN